MKKCGVCAKRYRGAGAYVFVAAQHDALGGLQRVRSCPSCAQAAIHLALPKRAPRCPCGAEATTCAGCENTRAPQIRAAVVQGAIVKLTKLLRHAYPEGHPAHFGVTIARDLLVAGDWKDQEVR